MILQHQAGVPLLGLCTSTYRNNTCKLGQIPQNDMWSFVKQHELMVAAGCAVRYTQGPRQTPCAPWMAACCLKASMQVKNILQSRWTYLAPKALCDGGTESTLNSTGASWRRVPYRQGNGDRDEQPLVLTSTSSGDTFVISSYSTAMLYVLLVLLRALSLFAHG